MTSHYQLCLYQPNSWPHGPAFEEIIESLYYGFKELGQELVVTCNQLLPGLRPIMLGAHVMPDKLVEHLPPNTIIYNFEHFIPNHVWAKQNYWNWIDRFTVWEYNHENYESLRKKLPHARIHYVPLGYIPQWTRIPDVEDPDIDVLFYGAPSPRRQVVLDELRASGAKVAQLTGVFNKQRDAWIARSKLVLNIHMSDNGLFESPRILYLQANRRCVVTECNRVDEIETDLSSGLKAVQYDQIRSTVLSLLKTPESRRELGQQGFIAVNAISRRSAVILDRAIRETGP